MLKVGWRTGHRLAEMVHHPSGEVFYLTRADVTWVISGVVVVDPTPAQLTRLSAGDYIVLAPPRSKTDQFGEVHCPFPSILLFDPERECNAGSALRDIELESPCRGSARAATPLFADSRGHPYRHGRMDDLLNAALLHYYGPGIAGTHSWHSLRSGLACALKAAGCPPEEIQLICRWVNPDSLRAYARIGSSQFISWVDKAEKALVDSIQTANLPKHNLCEGFAGLHIEFGRQLTPRARAVLDAAHNGVDSVEPPAIESAVPPPADAAPPPDLTPLSAANCIGRRVIVPQSEWPDMPCYENDGAGWNAHVIDYNSRLGAALIAYTDATTPRGVPYEDVHLQLHALRPA